MHPLDHQSMEHAGRADTDWRRARRAAAWTEYDAAAMPTGKEEVWRYVELDIDLGDYVTGAEAPPMGDDGFAGLLPDAELLAVVNGVATGTATDHLMPLRQALDERADAASVAAGAALPAATDIFAAAHDAFGGDGAFVHVTKGVVAPTVHIDVQTTAEGTASFPAVWINAEEGAEVSVVVHLRSSDGLGAMTIPQFGAYVGPGANVRLTLVQRNAYGVTSFGHAGVTMDRDASIRLFEVGLGGGHSRLHLDTRLEGNGSSANVVGAYFGEDTQTLDYRYFMHHVGTNTRSDMFLKGAVEDEADSVFTGLIRIEETGQKTEAFQTNRNLLLSDGATAQSVPNLEILANDVRCGHGSTVGPLDSEQRYYLMSRGLDRPRADRVQVRGFFEEVLSKLPEPALADPIRGWFNAKYESAQLQGRVR